MKRIWSAMRSCCRWYFKKPIWIIVVTSPIVVLAFIIGLLTFWLGVRFVLSPYPIHLHYPICNDGQVVFSPLLSPRYHEQMRGYVDNWDTAYAVMGNKLYTAANTDFEDNINKQIRTLANPDNQGLRTLGPQDHKTHKLFRIWDEMEEGRERRIAWCHLVEAVVSPTGIDIEARRNHPDIWPRDQFPLTEKE